MIVPLVPSPKNVNHQLEEFFDLLRGYTDELPSGSQVNPELRSLMVGGLEETLDGFTPRANACGKYFDISRYIPLWVVYEKNDDKTKSNAISVFDFLQKYYDWLYCDYEGGAQYLLSENLLNLIDIEKTKREFFNRYVYTFVSGIDENLLENNPNISQDAFIKFVKGIRRQFYHRKTTVDGLIYFFTTLFSVNPDDIYLYEPKVNLLRLNGGRFSNDKFMFIGGTGDYADTNNLAGSYLNNARLHDNDWIQEYSYLLSVGITSGSYIQTYLDGAHPTGLRVVFERKISDYVAPSDDIITDLLCETPKLKNYAAYSINTSYTTQIATGPNDTALYGLTMCTGCTATTYSGFVGPTYFFPNWSASIDQTKFNDINIFDFFNLCLDQGATSPNDPLTCTGCV